MTVEPKAAGGVVEGEQPKTEAQPSAQPKPAEPTTDAEREELSKLRTEVEAHRKTQAEQQRKIEEANRIIAQGGPTPPTTTPADPLDQQIAALQQQASEYPNDATVRFALEQAWQYKRQREQTRLMEQARPKFDAMPEAIRARAWQLWAGGYVLTPEIAQQVAEREQLGDVEKTKADLAKEREEIEKDKKARAEGRVGLGGRPVLGPDKPAGDGVQRVPQSKWDHLEDLPVDEQRAWLRKYNTGQVEIVPG